MTKQSCQDNPWPDALLVGNNINCIRYALRKKLRFFWGIFPKGGPPPPIPPFWEPLIQKKIIVYFAF